MAPCRGEGGGLAGVIDFNGGQGRVEWRGTSVVFCVKVGVHDRFVILLSYGQLARGSRRHWIS